MNIRSISFRLTAWYFAAFFISTLFIFTGFYLVTRETLLNQTDREISLHGSRILQVAGNSYSNSNQSFLFSQLSREFGEMPGMLIVITDHNGLVLNSSQPLNSDAQLFRNLSDQKSGFLFKVIGSVNMRLGIFPLESNSTTSGLIFVGHPVNVIMNSLNSLAITLLFVLIVISILSIFGGWLIAKTTLLPVTLLSAKLKKISLENLTEKVAIPQTGDELEELSHSFNSLLGRLSESFSRERMFIGDVAHELKTPLSTLKTSIEVLLTKKRSASAYIAGLDDALIDINHLSDSINDVLDLAWSESDTPLAQGKQLNLSALIVELMEVISRLASAKKIKIIQKIRPGLVVYGHRQKLFRSFFNLLDNAVKYTPVGGSITVTLDDLDQNVRFVVSNTGNGISQAELPYIFDRFYRGNKTPADTGSGLGLAISKSIINAHHGQISVSSTPGKTTTFTVILRSS